VLVVVRLGLGDGLEVLRFGAGHAGESDRLPPMRTLKYLLAAAVLIALAAPSTAGASIVPQQGMLGVKMGMTATQISARLGLPDSVSHPRNEIFGRYIRYRYGEVYIELFESNTQAFHFYTTGRSARTASGVGVGSPESYMRSSIKGETCRNEGGTRFCNVGVLEAGRIVTTFRVKSGKVTRVDIGRVID
jgi:hypothetical protein